jgi:hypothetical protein
MASRLTTLILVRSNNSFRVNPDFSRAAFKSIIKESAFCSVVINLSQIIIIFVLFSTIFYTAQLLRLCLLFGLLYGLTPEINIDREFAFHDGVHGLCPKNGA